MKHSAGETENVWPSVPVQFAPAKPVTVAGVAREAVVRRKVVMKAVVICIMARWCRVYVNEKVKGVNDYTMPRILA